MPGLDDSFTTLDGTISHVSDFRGEPVLVWIIAAGCSSCGSSVPAVAQNFGSFQKANVHILVLDIYGDLGETPHPEDALNQYGQEVAGAAFTSAAWTWGLASANLTEHYDSSAELDYYALLDSSGKVVYRNSTPVSTMNDLLRAVDNLMT